MTRTSENRSHLPFDPTRKTALAVGILYLLTFIGSIPGALLMAPILTNPNYVAGPGAATQIGIAAVCEMVNVLALIGLRGRRVLDRQATARGTRPRLRGHAVVRGSRDRRSAS